MRTHAAGNIACALVRPAPSVVLRDLWSAPSGTEKNRAAIRNDAYEPRITPVDRAIIRGYFRQHGLVPLLRPANKESLNCPAATVRIGGITSVSPYCRNQARGNSAGISQG